MNCKKCGNPMTPEMKFCAKCGTSVAQTPQTPQQQKMPAQSPVLKNNPVNPTAVQPTNQQNNLNEKPKRNKEKTKGKKKNLGLKITAVVLAVLVLFAGGILIFDTVSYKSAIEGAEYISDFPVLKQKTELTVYNAEKFPAEEYNIKVERMPMGGILKSGKLIEREVVVDENSTDPAFNIDFEQNGKYLITLTDITASRTQAEADSEDNKKDTEQTVVIIEAKVDDDDESAVSKVTLDDKKTDSTDSDGNASDTQTLSTVATDADFEQLEEIITLSTMDERAGDFNSETATTEEVVNYRISSRNSINLYGYYFVEGYAESGSSFAQHSKYQGDDPLDKFGGNNGGPMGSSHIKVPKKDIQWICENIFNVAFDENYASEKSYIHEDYCYMQFDKKGQFFIGYDNKTAYRTDSYKVSDGVYEVILGNYSYSCDEQNNLIKNLNSAKKVTAEIKIVDGERFWSIYKIEEYNGSMLEEVYKEPKLKVGECVYFGSYEQDNNTSNGREKLEWVVIDVEDGKALLLSKYVIDLYGCSESYSNQACDDPWIDCTCRTWLNGEFYNQTFTDSEKSAVQTTTVQASLDEDETDVTTQDKMFFLSSYNDFNYLNDSVMQASATELAKAKGVMTSNGFSENESGYCDWKILNHKADYGDVFGVISGDGYVANHTTPNIRPAMWVELG